MCFLGQTEHGVYIDDQLDEVHPDVLERYQRLPEDQIDGECGLFGLQRCSTLILFKPADLPLEMARDYAHHLNGEQVVVPAKGNPFQVQEHLQAFTEILARLEEEDFEPHGMGIRPEEWTDGEYPTSETITYGRSREPKTVQLPLEIWLPRARQWCRALFALNRFLGMIEDDA